MQESHILQVHVGVWLKYQFSSLCNRNTTQTFTTEPHPCRRGKLIALQICYEREERKHNLCCITFILLPLGNVSSDDIQHRPMLVGLFWKVIQSETGRDQFTNKQTNNQTDGQTKKKPTQVWHGKHTGDIAIAAIASYPKCVSGYVFAPWKDFLSKLHRQMYLVSPYITKKGNSLDG